MRGWKGLVGTSVGTHLPAVRAAHVGRDVPAAVRGSGFLICQLERFSVPTSVWPLRDFVDAYARTYEHPTDGADAPPTDDKRSDDKTEGESE